MQCTSFVREVMLLAVVVFLIFFVVYMAVPVGGVHESAGIITPSVTFHLFLAGIVPCVVSALLAGKGYQLDSCLLYTSTKAAVHWRRRVSVWTCSRVRWRCAATLSVSRETISRIILPGTLLQLSLIHIYSILCFYVLHHFQAVFPFN